MSNSFAEVTGEVCLKAMEFTRVGFNMPPTVPTPATRQDFLLLQKQLATGAKGEASGRGLPGGAGGSLLPPMSQLQTPGIVNPDIGKPVPPQSILPVIAVPPKVTPAPQPAPQPVFPPR